MNDVTITATEALERLKDGNRRFAAGEPSSADLTSPARRNELVANQNPFAIILGCSDSRVPAELVFDQGLGDLFVIRVAGNIVSPSQIGSVEFAAEYFGTQLVVVMGHTRCGAVIAAANEVKQGAGHESKNLRSIVGRIRPSVETVLENYPDVDMTELVHRAVRVNVRTSAEHLRHGSDILERLVMQDKLMIVGAEYSLDTGEVKFFDGV